MAQMVKCLLAVWETWVQSSLGQEDLLEKEMATHSRTLAWKIPWTEKRGRLQSMGLQGQRVKTERLHFHFPFLSSLVSLVCVCVCVCVCVRALRVQGQKRGWSFLGLPALLPG